MKKISMIFTAMLLATTMAIAQKTRIEMMTDSGRIVLMLYDNTPLNTANMIKQAGDHTYDSTLFHRCIPQFMIQGGDPESKHAVAGQMLGNGGLKYTIPAEINDSDYHKRGALGVARDNTPDKSGSATQFYIVQGKKFSDADIDNVTKRTGRKYSAAQREVYRTEGGAPHLDGNYTVFGEVTEGMDVVDKIAASARDKHDRPLGDVHIISVRVIEEGKHKKKHKKHRFLFF